MARKKQFAQTPDVEPSVRGFLDGAVVEIETVNIDVGPWMHVAPSSRNRTLASTVSRPALERTGGMIPF
jgi:hypothetical protein